MGIRSLIACAITPLVAGSGVSFARGTPSGEHATPIRVFDRTVVCKTKVGYVRVSARPGSGEPPSGGGLEVNGDPNSGSYTPGQWSSRGLPIAAVVAVEQGPDVIYRGASVEMKNCSRSTNKVPLTGKGLPASVAFAVSAICPTGGRVLVRLRYTYVPGPHHAAFPVGGRMRSALLAVRSYNTLKPLAFAKLTARGTKLQFSSANSCTTST